jgi:glyoxalase family protein
MQISGLHHVTAIAGDPQKNLDFYTGVMGLRLVKVTVNFDAPEVYHFYFGDATARPGSILTFFPFVGARPARQGIGQTFATAFAVPTRSQEFWIEHLTLQGISYTESERFGEKVLSFEDYDGTQLEIIEHKGADAIGDDIWDNGVIPSEAAIRGFHGVTIWEASQEPTSNLLTNIFGLKQIGQEGDRVRYEASSNELARHIDIIAKPTTPYASGGAGSVHHIAWRTPDDSTQLQWRELLANKGFNITPVRDRQYFHSIYFREPGGVLFEIATDEPGFLIDERYDELGQNLKLPPWLEANRDRIEASLQPIERPIITKEK